MHRRLDSLGPPSTGTRKLSPTTRSSHGYNGGRPALFFMREYTITKPFEFSTIRRIHPPAGHVESERPKALETGARGLGSVVGDQSVRKSVGHPTMGRAEVEHRIYYRPGLTNRDSKGTLTPAMTTTPSFDKALVGLTITEIHGAEPGSESVTIVTPGVTFRMHHDQSCCEFVRVFSVIGTPVAGRVLECVESDEPPAGVPDGYEFNDSHTWTVYRFTVAPTDGEEPVRFEIAWLGESNGNYSESVSFERVEPAA